MVASLVTDATDEPGKIANVDPKAAPVAGDTILINDGEDNDNPKSVDIDNLPGGGGFADPMTTRGDIIYRNASNVTARLPLGANSEVLQSDGNDLIYSNVPGGGGDMLKSVYDTIDDGTVNNSRALEGNDSAYHLSRTNHTDTQLASTISDFDTEVANETNVAANTTHRSSPGTDHSNVVSNNSHRTTVTGNPHVVTQTEVGLSNVDNTSDANKPVSTAQQTALDLKEDSLGFTPEDSANKGVNNGYASLDGSGTVPTTQLPNSVQNGIRVIGFWNATTNTPDLSSLTLNDGESYQVSVAGSTSLNSETNWKTRDLAVWEDGLAGNWFKIDNTDDVLSVNSQTGAVTLDTDDITEATNEYYTEAKVSANTSVALNTAKDTNATHTGEVTGDTALTITNNAVTTLKILNAAVTLVKMAAIATASFLGRNTAGSGDPEVLSAATARSILNVADGAIAEIVSDTTPQLGGDVDLNSNGFQLVGQTVGGSNGDLVYRSAAATWSQADADASATCGPVQLGIRVSATVVLLYGWYTTTGLTAGAIYFASTTAGGIVATTPPSGTSDIVRIIGYADSTTELFFDPDKTYITV